MKGKLCGDDFKINFGNGDHRVLSCVCVFMTDIGMGSALPLFWIHGGMERRAVTRFCLSVLHWATARRAAVVHFQTGAHAAICAMILGFRGTACIREMCPTSVLVGTCSGTKHVQCTLCIDVVKQSQALSIADRRHARAKYSGQNLSRKEIQGSMCKPHSSKGGRPPS